MEVEESWPEQFQQPSQRGRKWKKVNENKWKWNKVKKYQKVKVEEIWPEQG